MTENPPKFYQIIRGLLALPISSSSKVVWLSLWDRQGRNKTSWPSLTTICRDCGLSKGTVIKALQQLQENNLLKIQHPAHPSKKDKESNHYTVLLTGLISEPVQEETPFKGVLTGAETEPVQSPTGAETVPQPVQKLNPNVLKNKPNIKTAFEQARKTYPGTKRGLDTEFANFQKKHKDYRTAAKLLLPAIEREASHKKSLRGKGEFCPQWKHFQTWVNNRAWELEFPADSRSDEPEYSTRELTEAEADELLKECGCG